MMSRCARRYAPSRPVWGTTLCGAMLLVGAGAWAVEPPDTAKPAYVNQCGACHVAYPPGDLPARSWTAIMANLGHHFGEDASQDPATAGLIGQYLAYYAGGTEHGGSPDLIQDLPPDRTPLRITDLPAWRLHHAAVLHAGAAKLGPGPNSAANCAACHGSFALP